MVSISTHCGKEGSIAPLITPFQQLFSFTFPGMFFSISFITLLSSPLIFPLPDFLLHAVYLNKDAPSVP